YEKLLQAQPDYELPQHEAPKIRAIYARIKEDIKQRRVRPVTITLDAPAEAEGGTPVRVEVHVKDLALGSRPRLYYRRAGRQSFNAVEFERNPEDRAHSAAQIPSYEPRLPDSRAGAEYHGAEAGRARRRPA